MKRHLATGWRVLVGLAVFPLAWGALLLLVVADGLARAARRAADWRE